MIASDGSAARRLAAWRIRQANGSSTSAAAMCRSPAAESGVSSAVTTLPAMNAPAHSKLVHDNPR